MRNPKCRDRGGIPVGIWIWIVLACFFSKLALGKHKIGMEHFVWFLLPVDMYGIHLAGVTFKPYMIFCILLFIRMLLKGQTRVRVTRGWTLPSLGLIVAIFILNMFNSESLHSLSAPCMLMVVWFCMTIYSSNCGASAYSDIPEAMIAAGTGYGAVFIIGFLLLTMGISLPGVASSTRMQPGFFLQFSNMFNGALIETRRLRGFTIDPNTMLGTFVFSGSVSILRILMKKNSKREWICLVFSAICVFLSNSRTGMICFVLALFMSVVAAYRSGSVRTRNTIKWVTLLSIFAGVIVLITTDVIGQLFDTVLGLYANRSGLNDEYGRFTIWAEAFGILMERNPLFGIGMGQMQYYTSVNRACHNTWLECLCGNGLILGSALILFLLYILLKGLMKTIKNTSTKLSYIPLSLIVGVTVIMISLISVDNLTYSYLWFGLSTLITLDTLLENKMKYSVV